MWIRPSASASRGPTDDWWFNPVDAPLRGRHLSPEMARTLSIVYACVKVLRETVAQLPCILYRRLPNGGKERATAHPLSRLIGQRPNAWQTSFEWREMMEDHLSLRGNAYSRIVFDGPRIVGLVPLHPDLVEPRELDNGSWTYLYKSRRFGTQRIDFEDMLHLRGHATEGIIGLDPIAIQRQTVGFALAARDHGMRFYQNGATMPGWIEVPGNFANEEDKKKFVAAFREATTGARKFTSPVLEKGMKYHDLPLKHVDMQYLETLKDRQIDVVRIWRVPPHMVGILEGAIKSNIEQQAIEFVVHTLMPILKRWEQRLNESLLTDTEQEQFFCEFLVDGLLRGDSKARATFYRFGIQDGWLVRNEARIRENLNPLPGLDEPLQPLNMAGANEPPDEPPPDDDDDDRASALNMAAAERVVRKEVLALRKIVANAEQPKSAINLFYQEHRKYVQAVMLVDAPCAQHWCNEQLGRLILAKDNDFRAEIDSWLPTRAENLANMAITVERGLIQ